MISNNEIKVGDLVKIDPSSRWYEWNGGQYADRLFKVVKIDDWIQLKPLNSRSNDPDWCSLTSERTGGFTPEQLIKF